jgi:hypothetical protein
MCFELRYTRIVFCADIIVLISFLPRSYLISSSRLSFCFLRPQFLRLYTSHTFLRLVFKSTKVRWAGHVARIGTIGNTYKIFVGKPKRKWLLERLGVNRRIILKWIVGKRGLEVEIGFI